MSGSLDETLKQTEEQRDQSRELSLRADRPPLSIKGYTFVRRLGTGAYGSVWLAREDNTGKNVAIKFYTHRRGLDWSLLNREVEKLAVLYTSRNIVGLLDVGWNSDPPYYVMEYLDNGSLASWLAEGPLPPEEAVRVATGVAKGLVHAHGSGILHCDLKPANVLFDVGREPRLCDFGQSRLSHEQNPALGTLFFMAPEQADLQAVPDARWDVYALGALLYHMLTGSPPHRTTAAEERIRSARSLTDRLAAYRTLIAENPPPDGHRRVAGVDARLADIIDRCLSPDPAARFRNAQAVLGSLQLREQHRARGPLLKLGVIGPLLLLAAMAPLFLSVMKNNVSTLEKQLTTRALESDALTARVQAQSLEDELYYQVGELEDVLANPRLIDALSEAVARPAGDVVSEFKAVLKDPGVDAPDWVQQLDAAYNRVADRAARRGQADRTQDTSWFVTTANGIQIWRRAKGESSVVMRQTLTTLGNDYSFRDYFHGRGVEYKRGSVPAGSTIINRPDHFSIPFRSEATDRYMIAVTVKILGPRSADGQRPVLGLIGRTTHLDEFRGRFVKRIRRRLGPSEHVDREIALVDARNWQLLDHSWIAEAARAANAKDHENGFSPDFRAEARRLFADPDTLFDQLRLPADLVERISNQSSDAPHLELLLEDYQDPVGEIDSPTVTEYRGKWLAALYGVDVGDAQWVVIIQERSAAALDAVNEMTSVARYYGLVAILLSIAVILLVWWFVTRTMKNLGRQTK